MIIRRAKIEDEDVIYELLCELENKILDRDRFHTFYLDYIENDRIYCFVAEERQAVVGVLSLLITSMLCRVGCIGEILELSVRSDMRSRGVGRELFQAALKTGRENGCVRVEVSSNMARPRAHQFYIREGMRKSHFRFIYDLSD